MSACQGAQPYYGTTPVDQGQRAVQPPVSGVATPGSSWERVSPEQAGWSPEHLEEAKRRFHELGATGLVVVYKGRLLAAWGDVTTPVNCHSVRKSFMSALLGIYAHEKRLTLSKTLGELGIDDYTPLTATEKSATVYDLLKARSGVYLPAVMETPKMKATRPLRGSHAPGTFFYYNNWDFNALGTIFEQAAKRSIFSAFDEKIGRPIGMEHFRADRCRYASSKKTMHRGYRFFMSTLDRARFGLLYLREGRWGSKQIIPKAWVTESTRVHSKGSKGIGYGYLWWVSTGRWHLGARVRGKAYSARGNWGQKIIVLPDHQVVVAVSSSRKRGYPNAAGRKFKRVFSSIVRAMPR